MMTRTKRKAWGAALQVGGAMFTMGGLALISCIGPALMIDSSADAVAIMMTSIILTIVIGVALMWRGSELYDHAMRGHCPQCDYDLRGQLEAGCPECGWRRSSP